MLSLYHSSYEGEVVNSNFGSLALTPDKTLLAVGGATDCAPEFGSSRGNVIRVLCIQDPKRLSKNCRDTL